VRGNCGASVKQGEGQQRGLSGKRGREKGNTHLEFCQCLVELCLATRDNRDVCSLLYELDSESETKSFGTPTDVTVLREYFGQVSTRRRV
jgi:hypothetical protein